MPKVDLGSTTLARAIAQCQCPGRARWPASPAASHAHTTLLGLGSQALRQPRLRAVVASSVLDAPSRQHGCRGPRAPRGVWASCMRTATECARRRLPSVTAEPRVPPPNAQESERAKACKARRAQ